MPVVSVQAGTVQWPLSLFYSSPLLFASEKTLAQEANLPRQGIWLEKKPGWGRNAHGLMKTQATSHTHPLLQAQSSKAGICSAQP